MVFKYMTSVTLCHTDLQAVTTAIPYVCASYKPFLVFEGRFLPSKASQSWSKEMKVQWTLVAQRRGVWDLWDL